MAKRRILTASFAWIYPLLVAKEEKKGHSREEADQAIRLLTGYDTPRMTAALEVGADIETFFARAPAMRESRCLNKLMGEQARGRPMENILQG